jgi:hypothetical protein
MERWAFSLMRAGGVATRKSRDAKRHEVTSAAASRRADALELIASGLGRDSDATRPSRPPRQAPNRVVWEGTCALIAPRGFIPPDEGVGEADYAA